MWVMRTGVFSSKTYWWWLCHRAQNIHHVLFEYIVDIDITFSARAWCRERMYFFGIIRRRFIHPYVGVQVTIPGLAIKMQVLSR
jgi:hypothetical protein